MLMYLVIITTAYFSICFGNYYLSVSISQKYKLSLNFSYNGYRTTYRANNHDFINMLV